MTVTDEQFFAAVEDLKQALVHLRKCKPHDVAAIEAAHQKGEAAGRVIDLYLAQRLRLAGIESSSER